MVRRGSICVSLRTASVAQAFLCCALRRSVFLALCVDVSATVAIVQAGVYPGPCWEAGIATVAWLKAVLHPHTLAGMWFKSLPSGLACMGGAPGRQPEYFSLSLRWRLCMAFCTLCLAGVFVTTLRPRCAGACVVKA